MPYEIIYYPKIMAKIASYLGKDEFLNFMTSALALSRLTEHEDFNEIWRKFIPEGTPYLNICEPSLYKKYYGFLTLQKRMEVFERCMYHYDLSEFAKRHSPNKIYFNYYFKSSENFNKQLRELSFIHLSAGIKTYINHLISINARNEYQMDVLCAMVTSGWLQGVYIALSCPNININYQIKNTRWQGFHLTSHHWHNYVPLLIAAECGYVNIAKLLITQGANTTIKIDKRYLRVLTIVKSANESNPSISLLESAPEFQIELFCQQLMTGPLTDIDLIIKKIQNAGITNTQMIDYLLNAPMSDLCKIKILEWALTPGNLLATFVNKTPNAVNNIKTKLTELNNHLPGPKYGATTTCYIRYCENTTSLEKHEPASIKGLYKL